MGQLPTMLIASRFVNDKIEASTEILTGGPVVIKNNKLTRPVAILA